MSNWLPWRRPSPENSDTSDHDEQPEQTELPPPTSPSLNTPLSAYTQQVIAASEITEEQCTQLICEWRQLLQQQLQQEQGEPSNLQPPPENTEFIIPLDKDDEQTLQQAFTLFLQDSANENLTEPKPI